MKIFSKYTCKVTSKKGNEIFKINKNLKKLAY